MAIYNGRILMRKGNEADFDPEKMMAGEWAVSLDKRIVRMCVQAGICIRMATYEAFEEDMAQIKNILAECKTIEEAVRRINTEINAKVNAVVEYVGQAKTYRDEAKAFRNEAEQFKNEAFNTTPSGYDELVDQVNTNTAKIDTIIEKADLRIKADASGEEIHLTDSADGKAVEYALYGKATQNGEPTPENPAEIEVAGASGSVEVKSLGKNYLKNTVTSQTKNEVVIKVNEDKSILVNTNGTTTVDTTIILCRSTDVKLKSGKYILNGTPKNDNQYKFRLHFFNSTGKDEVISDYGDGNTIEFIDNGQNWNVSLFIKAGTQISNLTFYPMISKEGGEYEPYKETLSTIPTPNGIAGIKVDSGGNYTDQNGQQWVCDEIVKYADGSGAYIQRIGKSVFDGSEDEQWSQLGSEFGFRYKSLLSKNVVNSDKSNGVFSMNSSLQPTNYGGTYSQQNSYTITNNAIYVSLSGTETLEEIKEYLSTKPMTVLATLAEPIETPLTAEEIAEIETFYSVTNISNDFDCGMKVTYVADSKNYIDNQLAKMEQAREQTMMSMFLLLPEETQATMIENDVNNLLTESEN